VTAPSGLPVTTSAEHIDDSWLKRKFNIYPGKQILVMYLDRSFETTNRKIRVLFKGQGFKHFFQSYDLLLEYIEHKK
jgi:hypothetical protein